MRSFIFCFLFDFSMTRWWHTQFFVIYNFWLSSACERFCPLLLHVMRIVYLSISTDHFRFICWILFFFSFFNFHSPAGAQMYNSNSCFFSMEIYWMFGDIIAYMIIINGIIWFQLQSKNHLRIVVFEKDFFGQFGGITLARLNEKSELRENVTEIGG